MSYLLPPVVYLEAKDFTPKGNLKHFKNKTCIIMVQANYCKICTSAKTYFQNFAKKDKSVVCLTIQGDGTDSKEIVDLVTKIKPSFEGYPDYLLFKNGKYINKEIKGRTEAFLKEFIQE